jgi:hypothetical protein
VSSADEKIDQLYQLPLGEFTAARNALAKTLAGAEGARVKALTKPTVVPWTVNQLYWHARKTYDRLADAGRELREAQIAALRGRASDVGRATEAHRTALAIAVREALALAARQKVQPSSDQLARMLEALSLAPAGPTPGQLTELIQPSGFEALTGMTAAAGAAARPAAVARRVPDRQAEATAHKEREKERRRAAEAAAERRRAEAAVRTAERTLDKARAAESAAAAAVVRAQQSLSLAEDAREEARRERQTAEKALFAAKGALL